jgi:hypothetical protein
LKRFLALALLLLVTGSVAALAQQSCLCVAQSAGLASTFFAMSSTLNGGAHNPSVTGVGVKRSWNNSPFCTFGITNPSSGTYDFSNCNAPFDLASSIGAKPDFVYGLTPCWAVAGENAGCTGGICTGVYKSSAQCAQPTNDIGTTDAILKAHVTALVNYVQGRYPTLHNWYIECVNEFDLTSEWTGTMAQLVKYCTDIKTTAQALDATIIMIGPSSSSYNALGVHGSAYMAASGAAASFDAWGQHPYFFCQSDLVTPFGTFACKIPDQSIAANPVLDAFRVANGIANKPVYMTEVGWGTSNTLANMSDSDREAWIGREMMYTYNSGYAANWSYTWDCPSGTLSSCDSTISGSGVGAGVATSWQTYESWLVGSQHVVNSCNQNVDGNSTWSCPITSAGGAAQAILFNRNGNQTVTVSSAFTTQDFADGTNAAIVSHQIVAGVLPTRVR